MDWILVRATVNTFIILIGGISYEFTDSCRKLRLVYPHQMPSYPKKYQAVCQKKILLTFNINTNSMTLPKLTAFFLCLSILFVTSCNDTEELEDENIYYGKALPMSSSQETPPFTSTATGTIDANYNRLTKTLSYKITFSGLSGTGATAAHIHGLGEPGIIAGVLQTFTPFPAATSGTFSGTLLIDGVKFTEEHLLAGRYYMNIHTAAKPGGEIRGQLILSK